jgi:hypothetical protein
MHDGGGVGLWFGLKTEAESPGLASLRDDLCDIA